MGSLLLLLLLQLLLLQLLLLQLVLVLRLLLLRRQLLLLELSPTLPLKTEQKHKSDGDEDRAGEKVEGGWVG